MAVRQARERHELPVRADVDSADRQRALEFRQPLHRAPVEASAPQRPPALSRVFL